MASGLLATGGGSAAPEADKALGTTSGTGAAAVMYDPALLYRTNELMAGVLGELRELRRVVCNATTQFFNENPDLKE